MGPAFAAVVVTLGWQGTSALRDLGRRAVRWRGVGRWWWSVPGILALGVVGWPPRRPPAPRSTSAVSRSTAGRRSSRRSCSSATCWSSTARRGVRLAGPARRRAGRPGRRGASGADRHRGVGDVAPADVLGRRELPVDGLANHRVGAGAARRVDVMLTRLYVGSGRSVLLVALWHTAFNFTTATTATEGLSAAITSTAVMAAAVVVLVRARVRDRAARAARRARPMPSTPAPTTPPTPKRVPRPHRDGAGRFVAWASCSSSSPAPPAASARHRPPLRRRTAPTCAPSTWTGPALDAMRAALKDDGLDAGRVEPLVADLSARDAVDDRPARRGRHAGQQRRHPARRADRGVRPARGSSRSTG